MIAVAANIFVRAHREDSLFHAPAFQRVAEFAEGPAGWAIPWPCLHEFLAIGLAVVNPLLRDTLPAA